MVIVAAASGSDHERVVREGRELAAAFGEELHVVSVLSMSEPQDDIGGVSSESRDRLKGLAAERAEEAAEPIDDGSITTVGVVADDVDDALLEYAADVDANYLVVGGRKRSPAGKAIFGSTTQSVLLNADRPVLVVMSE